jgi:hypothetical protein
MKRISTLPVTLLSSSPSFVFSLFVLLAVATSLQAQQIAFPGAEGAGKFTSGGRGTPSKPTTVFEVTNLTDVNSPGSLRYACAQSIATYPYRTIVFRVSGTIHLASKLSVPANTTIAGQTAPGDGICLADWPVVISGDNVIVRYIRCRMGDKNQNKGKVDGSGGDDALGNLGNKNLIIDHCSVSWSDDEALTIYRGDSLTIQWNFITEPLNYSYHFEAGDADYEQHGYGGIQGARHGTIHHNLFAHCRNRTPRFAGVSTYSPAVQGAEMADYRNNVIYNWGIGNVYGGEGGYYNMVNNYFKYGPNTTSRKYQVVGVDSSDTQPYARYYLSGNYVDGSTTNTNNNWLSVTMKSGNLADTVKSKVTTPFDLPALPTETALQAFNSVLAYAGCSLPNRDTLDQRIVNDVKNRVGRIIDVQGGYPHGTAYDQTVNAWPALNSLPAPTDTDHDGMPDDWETQNGLNPNNAADRSTIGPDGYTMLEVYLNSLATNANVLPLSLLNFSATVVSDNVPKATLIWSTASEINVKQFEVEKSVDGTSFTFVGLVKANNNSTTNDYSFTDVITSNGVVYYRLKIVNNDGSFRYSSVTAVRSGASNHLSVFPNPVTSQLSISHAKASANAQVKILSIDGKTLMIKKLIANTTQTAIDVSVLIAGTYFAVLTNGVEKGSISFIKE